MKYEKIIKDCETKMIEPIPEFNIKEDLDARVDKLKVYMNK